jgi:hypothetical protein
VSVQGDRHSARPSTIKTTENIERIQELINEDCCETILELADTVGTSYGVYQEILKANLNTVALPLHHVKAPAHTSLKATELVTNSNMVIIPYPPYSLDLAPVILLLFSKLKVKLMDDVLKQCLTSKGNPQTVLNSIKENEFHSDI